MDPPVYPTITLDLILDRVYTKEVLHGVLHSILFHRLFGTIKPQTIEVLDVTMPGVDNPVMEQLVNEKVDAFWKGIEGGSKRGQILVTFSERKPKKSWFQVYMGEEDVPWEQWIINAELRQLKSDQGRVLGILRPKRTLTGPLPLERASLHSALSATLTKIVFTMLTHTSSEQGRAAVPLITNAAGISPFPIQINVKVGDVERQTTIPYHIQSAMVQRHARLADKLLSSASNPCRIMARTPLAFWLLFLSLVLVRTETHRPIRVLGAVSQSNPSVIAEHKAWFIALWTF
ncbi:hypothetical protein NMY22_g12835 [Coprinellus aureogranulatus]|nr:hypothetical protein NMY22_g12835 [Coprinellus aureogranulatus]